MRQLQWKTLLIGAAALLSPCLAGAASFGVPPIYDIDARDRARIIGVITQSHADGSYVREHVTVMEIYGHAERRPLECNAGVAKFDTTDLKPGLAPEFVTNVGTAISVCFGR